MAGTPNPPASDPELDAMRASLRERAWYLDARDPAGCDVILDLLRERLDVYRAEQEERAGFEAGSLAVWAQRSNEELPAAVAVDPQPASAKVLVCAHGVDMRVRCAPCDMLGGLRQAAVDPSPPEPEHAAMPNQGAWICECGNSYRYDYELADHLAAVGQPVEPTRTPPLPSEPLAQQGKLLSGAEGPVRSRDAGSGPSITAVEPDAPTDPNCRPAEYDDGYQAGMEEALAARTQVGWYNPNDRDEIISLPAANEKYDFAADGWLPVWVEGEQP